MQEFSRKKILLIVTGGIACYKALDLIRKLQEKKASIECILTKNASEFVNPLSFESLLGKKVHSNLFSLNEEKEMTHIKLANYCDLKIVVPCTANFLGKMANGVADDLATNILLASKNKKIIAPAMNTNMWNNSAVKNNIETLTQMGVKVLAPESGKLACGTVGTGKLMDVESIIDCISDLLRKNQKLAGIKAIVTSGPSIEKIDPIRFVSNFSSGLQGYEIASSLSKMGAKTTLISGPTSMGTPTNVKLIKVQTAKEFLESSISELPCDVFISVAAISDWKAKKISKKKLKKENFEFLDLRFSKNIDVLKTISNHKKRPKLVIGFSAETENLIKNSVVKLKNKNCDWIIANKVSASEGFKTKTNKVFFIDNNETLELPKMSKKTIAEKLSKKIVSFFKNNKLKSYE